MAFQSLLSCKTNPDLKLFSGMRW